MCKNTPLLSKVKSSDSSASSDVGMRDNSSSHKAIALVRACFIRSALRSSDRPVRKIGEEEVSETARANKGEEKKAREEERGRERELGRE